MREKQVKRVVFVTGTRADFSKIKSLMYEVERNEKFELYIFATGMHMSKKFGLTIREIEKSGFKKIFRFINHDKFYQNDIALANTISGFSKFVAEFEPELIVVHGDRIEPLAACIVGALNNILVAHIEGGEVSGTIDNSIRHAISKFANIHLVNNEKAKKRLIQLGENENSIFITGSPDIDILESNDVNIDEVKSHYGIKFKNYAIAMFHPVTTEYATMSNQAKEFVSALKKSNKQFVVIMPNNDLGFNYILDAYEEIQNDPNFVIFPSIRFEYFLTLLKECDFIVGNSSCILNEAVELNKNAINVGSRQNNRDNRDKVINVKAKAEYILQAIVNLKPKENIKRISQREKSSEIFGKLLKSGVFFDVAKQKIFVDKE